MLGKFLLKATLSPNCLGKQHKPLSRFTTVVYWSNRNNRFLFSTKKVQGQVLRAYGTGLAKCNTSSYRKLCTVSIETSEKTLIMFLFNFKNQEKAADCSCEKN